MVEFKALSLLQTSWWKTANKEVFTFICELEGILHKLGFLFRR